MEKNIYPGDLKDASLPVKVGTQPPHNLTKTMGPEAINTTTRGAKKPLFCGPYLHTMLCPLTEDPLF